MDDIVEDGIREELSHPEHFDVMIANLLGLGHIGHVAGTVIAPSLFPNFADLLIGFRYSGSRSPLISEKLTEIDTVVKSIYDRLQEFVSAVICILKSSRVENVGGRTAG